MAIEITQQYRYSSRGPLDGKALVKTFTDLLSEATWETENKKLAAYNGMIVAVWLDGEKNGIYYLHDPAVTSTFKAPDVANEANWHKLADLEEFKEILNRLNDLELNLSDLTQRVQTLETEPDVVTYGYKSGFPKIGKPNKLYVAVDQKKSYVWVDNDYIPVSDSDITYSVIFGGSAEK